MRACARPPSSHWLGTDQLGRDLFFRVMLGARTSLTIAGAAVLMSLVLGLPLGMVSGFYRGRHRQRADAPRRHAAELSGAAAGADDQRHAGPERAERDHRHRGRLHAVSGAHRARRGAAGRADALCRGSARRREPTICGSHPRHVAAQRDAADHRPGDDQSRLRDPCRGGPVVPRPRHPAAAILLGSDDPGVARLSRRRALDRHSCPAPPWR